MLLLALANVTKVGLLYCCMQVNHGHWCLIWPLIFPFSLARSLLMRQFVITFSKYWGIIAPLSPHVIFFVGGHSPLSPHKFTPLTPSTLFMGCDTLYLRH